MLQDLYDSEINVRISWNWDAGIDVQLGGLPGYNESAGCVDKDTVNTIEEAEQWLKEKAIEFYPNSVFAKKYSRSLDVPGFEGTQEQLKDLKIR